MLCWGQMVGISLVPLFSLFDLERALSTGSTTSTGQIDLPTPQPAPYANLNPKLELSLFFFARLVQRNPCAAQAMQFLHPSSEDAEGKTHDESA